MATPQLDDISRAILARLAADGRASYQALADDVGLSRPAVMERVKRLGEQGYIRGYAALLDREKLGLPVTAFIAVRFPTPEPGSMSEIEALEAHPNVLECHHVAGDDCYILKVAAPSLAELGHLLGSMKGSSSQASTRTTIVLSTVFEKGSVKPPEGPSNG